MKQETISPNNIKSEEEIEYMISLIQKAIDTTPKFNAWGDSNARDISDMKAEVRNLKMFLRKGTVEKWTEARLWLEGNPNNFLKDFEI
jgi:hypothetical protein